MLKQQAYKSFVEVEAAKITIAVTKTATAATTMKTADAAANATNLATSHAVTKTETTAASPVEAVETTIKNGHVNATRHTTIKIGTETAEVTPKLTTVTHVICPLDARRAAITHQSVSTNGGHNEVSA